MNVNFLVEFLKAAEQGPCLFFAPLFGAIKGARDQVNQIDVLRARCSRHFEEAEMPNELQHQGKVRDAIISGSAWLVGDRSQLELLGRWEAEGKIFGVDYLGVKRYAAYQFDEEGIPLPIIREILIRLHFKSPWVIAAWFQFPNSWIVSETGPIPPKAALGRQAEILDAAERVRGTYIV